MSAIRHMVACGLLTAAAASAVGTTGAVGFDFVPGRQVSLNLPLYEASGKAAVSGRYFGTVPVLLMFNYFRCTNLCSTTLAGLFESASAAGLQPGGDVQLVAISIDPRDTPADARSKQAELARRYPIAQSARFLTGPQASLERLQAQAGFKSHYDARFDQYLHPAGLFVLSPSGKTTRLLMGVRYPSAELRAAVADAAKEHATPASDTPLLRCSQFDPAHGPYDALIGWSLRALALAGILALAAWLLPHRRQQ